MLYANFDYPTSHITIHRDPNCVYLEEPRWAKRRVRRINIANITAELAGFRDRAHRFDSGGGLDSMWLQVDFGDPTFEMAVVRYVQQFLGRRYTPFRKARITVCCPASARG